MIGATLFSGGRGVETLLRRRIDFRYAVESDARIAEVGAQLGGHTFVARVEDVDYSAWGAIDYLHASPVCKEYSQAKSGGAEGESDLSAAAAVVRCLEATRPRVFTLENVSAYQRGQAYARIVTWLNHHGYMWHAEVLNAANFGVPQTRRRLVLRAVKDALLPPLPPPVPWVGWYAAIEDLIPTLPPSRFAPWQLARLPDGLRESTVVHRTDMRSMPTRNAAEPIFTITAGSFDTSHAPGMMPRAFIVEGQTGLNGTMLNVRSADDPLWTVSASMDKRPSLAWLVGGRVVKMTPRALARFQSFPDSYQLPDKASLACTIIGNAVPPLMMQQIVEPLLRGV